MRTAQEATERQRPKVPDDFDGALEVAELDGCDIRAVVVALRRVVVQPANDVVDARLVDDHGRLIPDDIDALHRRAELRAQGFRGGIGDAVAVRNVFRRDRRGRVGALGVTGDDGKKL